jgi:hypothetical protein
MLPVAFRYLRLVLLLGGFLNCFVLDIDLLRDLGHEPVWVRARRICLTNLYGRWYFFYFSKHH